MKNRYIHIFSFVAALLMLATFSACEADDKIVFVTGTDIDKEESEYVSLIDVTDNSDADWNTLPAEYVFETKCADGASLDALKSVKVFADEIYVNLLVEWDTEQVTDLRSVAFHVYWNIDGDAETGGYGDKWLEPYDIDIMMEGFFYLDEEGLGIGEPCAYEPGMLAYGGAYNTNEWNWSELTAAGAFCFSQHLGDNKMEIQFLRGVIPASLGEEFTIGFDIQQMWTDVGVLPNAADDPITGARVRANKLKVKVNTSESSTDTPKENIPVVVTSAITQITETSAVAGGNVTSDGGASVIERGVVYSTNPNPVITNLSNTIRPCGSGTGEFTYNITDLQPNTTYYLRAYAKNDVGTAYGEEVSFTTETQSALKGSQFWPIAIDGTTADANASKMVGDFRPDDVGKFLCVWDSTYVVNDNPTGPNFHGNTDGYTSLIVSTMGWAGCAYCLTETDASNAWQAAEALRAAIVASPDDYYLHMALKSTDAASHCFYIFGSEATKFVIGYTAVYDGPIYANFTRDGEWAEFDIPMSRFATALATTTCAAGVNVFVALSEGEAGVRLNMDAIYFYKK